MADERTTLLAFLEWQCATLARKCEGLTVERLRLRSTAPSNLGKGHRDDSRRIKLRWILVHTVEEYSRHNGHADLLRERIDGSVGYWTGDD